MHTDVGGGYKEQNLSDIPLVWMIEKAIKYGLRLYIPDDPNKVKIDINENANGFMHNSREGTLNQFYRQEIRHWDDDIGMPWIHQSVLDRANNPENNYHPWILEQYKIKDQDYRVVDWNRYDQVIKSYIR